MLFRNCMPAPRASIVAFVIFGLSGGADAGQEAKDMRLEDMGFVMRPADTPAQIERLRALPARTFVGRTKDDRRLLSLCRSRLLQMRVRRQ